MWSWPAFGGSASAYMEHTVLCLNNVTLRYGYFLQHASGNGVRVTWFALFVLLSV